MKSFLIVLMFCPFLLGQNLYVTVESDVMWGTYTEDVNVNTDLAPTLNHGICINSDLGERWSVSVGIYRSYLSYPSQLDPFVYRETFYDISFSVTYYIVE